MRAWILKNYSFIFFALAVVTSSSLRAQDSVTILEEFDSKLSSQDVKLLEQQSKENLIPPGLSKKWSQFLKKQGTKAGLVQKNKSARTASLRARKVYDQRLKTCRHGHYSDAWVTRVQKKFPREFLDQYHKQFHQMIIFVGNTRQKECEGTTYEDLTRKYQEWLDIQLLEQTLYEDFYRSLTPKEQAKYPDLKQKIQMRREVTQKMKGKPPAPVYHVDDKNIPSEKVIQTFPKEIREFCESEKAFKKPFDTNAAVASFYEVALAPIKKD